MLHLTIQQKIGAGGWPVLVSRLYVELALKHPSQLPHGGQKPGFHCTDA
jgi:hypothetical protein